MNKKKSNDELSDKNINYSESFQINLPLTMYKKKPSDNKKLLIWSIDLVIILPDFSEVNFEKKYMIDENKPLIKMGSGAENGKIVPSTTLIKKTKSGKTIFDYAKEKVRQIIYDRFENKDYFFNRDDAINYESMKPMLLQSYSKLKHKINWNDYFFQPKIDGERSFVHFNGKEFIFNSRKNRPFLNLNHISSELENIKEFKKDGIYIDGELYVKGFDLQKIHSILSKEKKLSKDDMKLKSKIVFIIFDIANVNNKDWLAGERFDYLKTIFSDYKENFKFCKLIPFVLPVKSEEEMKELHSKYVELGYEGIVMRNLKSKYLFGRRANLEIIKRKYDYDDDFIIVGYTVSEEGNQTGAIIWLCETKDKKQFKVVPIAKIEDRKKIVKEVELNPNNFIGKLLQVRFKNYTSDGIPSHANSSLYPKI